MRNTIFRQYDSRWGHLKYPSGIYTLDRAGCGCCSCAHLLIEMEKYKNYTPKTIRSYMVKQGFATRGNGTTWNGITKTLEHYGYKVVKPNISSSMDAAWKELNKGNRAGILLFGAGSRGGVTWTSGGHYIAFLAYKVKNGKHYFYTKDSGPRCHDGWYCYETTMRGLLPQMWIVELPAAPKKTTTTTKKKSTGKYYSVGKYYTLQATMNIRTGASTNYKIVGTKAKGSKVKCLQTSKDGKWIRIGEYKWICGRDSNQIYLK